MTKIAYDSVDYAASRLVGTVVRVGENPVTVVGINDLDDVVVETLVKKTRKHVPLSRLNLEPVRLGYVNYNSHAIYASRVPKRNDWRQGLRLENMHFSQHVIHNVPTPQLVWETDEQIAISVAESRSPRAAPRTRIRPIDPSWSAIYQTIRGNYPSFKSCLCRINELRSIAWCRDFCLVKQPDDYIVVEWMGDHIVGKLYDDDVIRLDDKFKYLEERLMEA